MSYYPEPVILEIKDKVKVNLSKFATKKKLVHATDNDTSDLAV